MKDQPKSFVEAVDELRGLVLEAGPVKLLELANPKRVRLTALLNFLASANDDWDEEIRDRSYLLGHVSSLDHFRNEFNRRAAEYYAAREDDKAKFLRDLSDEMKTRHATERKSLDLKYPD